MTHRTLIVPCVLVVLSGCASPKPTDNTDPTLVQLTKSAQQAFEIGATARAARFYELSLTRAWTIDDGAEVANNAFNLAACYIKLGRLDDADAMLVEAKGEFVRINRDVSDVLLLQARVAQARGQAEQSQARLDEVVKTARSDDARLQAWIIKTDLACDAGDAAKAKQDLAAAQRLFNDTKDDALRAGVTRISGRVFLLEKLPARAAAEFDREVQFQQKAAQYGEMARALDRAGQAWHDAGDPAKAADRWYRAARSDYAQGNFAAALKSVDTAMAAASEGGHADLKAQCAELLASVRKEVDREAAAGLTNAPPR